MRIDRFGVRTFSSKDALRLLLTFVLLCVVYRNAHWSVALAITGLSIGNEISAAWRD